jgi:hypothetical protein
MKLSMPKVRKKNHQFTVCGFDCAAKVIEE